MSDQPDNVVLVLLRRIDARLQSLEMDTRLRLSALEGRFSALETRFSSLEGRIDLIDARLERIERRLDLVGHESG